MAIKTFTGTVAILAEKEFNGRNGKAYAYSAKVEKADGSEYEEWLGLGFKKPDFEKGDEVVITAQKEKGFWKAIEVEVTKRQTAGDQDQEDQESGASGSAGSAASSAPAASSSRKIKTDESIHYQNSRTAAIALTDLLLRNNALPVTGTTGKAGTAKREEEITAVVNKYTVILYHDLQTFRLINDIEDVYEKPETEEAFDGAASTDDLDE
jgi:hypothetical protein